MLVVLQLRRLQMLPAKKIAKGNKGRDYVDRMKRVAKELLPLLTREDPKETSGLSAGNDNQLSVATNNKATT